MKPSEPMTPSEIGERAEAAIAAALAQAGKSLLIPFGQCRYDLAYEDGERLVKVQCKSGREHNGAVVFHTHSAIHGAYRDYRRDVHLFGVYCHDRREIIDTCNSSGTPVITATKMLESMTHGLQGQKASGDRRAHRDVAELPPLIDSSARPDAGPGAGSPRHCSRR